MTTVTPHQIIDPEQGLPDGATGVDWGGWTECRAHLEDFSWRQGVAGFDYAGDEGTVLYGELTCDACAEAETY